MKRSAVLTLAATLLSLAFAGTAWAHPAYKASNPGKDATVSEAPSEVWVEFTESIEGGQVEVFNPCGEQVDNHDSTRNLTNDRITVTLTAHHAGTYLVHWEVLGEDSHATQGDFTFTSSNGHKCPVEPEDPKEEPRERDPDPKPRQQDDRRVSMTETQTDDTEDRVKGTREQRSAANARAAQREQRPRSNERRDVLAQAPAPRPTGDEREEPGIWDGIPIGDFLVALLVAAMIGAAGGRIYAGILGPKA